MAKQKSNKSALRRFRVTGSGKVLRRVSSARHLRRKKSATQKRRQQQTRQLTGRLARRVLRRMAKA